MIKPSFLLICIFILPAVSVVAQDGFLKFKQIQGHALEARVTRYDLDNQIVTLTNREGQEIQVDVADLSAVDKRLVVKAVERQLFQKSKARAKDIPEAGNPEAGNPVANHPGVGNPAGAVAPRLDNRRQPLVWSSSLKQATAKAIGTDALGDDRPIVWFRVLGDLRGLM
ncbi:MAG: hypothetical protein JNL67_18735 [Planctomycetaceae bacterium]|nr:hypothetical protein [Planctomycetaceae bacterium]